jgi:hypothetical protein
MTGLLQAVAPIALVLEVSAHSLTGQHHQTTLAHAAEPPLHPAWCATTPAVAGRHSRAGRTLQGGYNLEATAAGVEACMRVCLGERPPPLRPDGRELPAPSAPGLAAIREALILQVHTPALALVLLWSSKAAAARTAKIPSEALPPLRLCLLEPWAACRDSRQ